MSQAERSWSRGSSFQGDLVLLDGISGTGKTMLMRLIDSFADVIPPKFNYQFEHICIAIAEMQISESAGLEILQIILDQSQYDASISREINLRPGDLSSILKSPKRFEYIKRAFQPDGQAAGERVESKREKIFLVVQ